jgi:hypothetical protein
MIFKILIFSAFLYPRPNKNNKRNVRINMQIFGNIFAFNLVYIKFAETIIMMQDYHVQNNYTPFNFTAKFTPRGCQSHLSTMTASPDQAAMVWSLFQLIN